MIRFSHHLVDGQVLEPTAFGRFNSNGVWVPKAYGIHPNPDLEQ